MKTRMITVALILSGFSAAISQGEFDDVYFTKKDRVAKVSLPSERPQRALNALGETNAAYQAVAPSVPMHGYTGRTINPDYQPAASATVASSYFTPNYQPARVNNQLNSYTNNFNNYSNYGYGYNRYGNRFGNGYCSPYGMNSWGYSPYSSYGGGYYSPYNSGFGYNPYGFGNGFSMFSGMGYGMYSGMGWGGGYYGNGYSGYGGGYYPHNVIVVNNPDSHINKVYGKRESRTSDYSNMASNHTGRGNGIISSPDPNQGGNRGGRVAASSGSSNAYYQRGWRQDPTISQTTNSGSGYSVGTSGGRTTWGSFNNTPSHGSTSGVNNSSFGTSRGSFSGGSFGSSGGSSSGGRSSGGSSGGGHSSGGTRGRN